jgi:hypothetical protein
VIVPVAGVSGVPVSVVDVVGVVAVRNRDVAAPVTVGVVVALMGKMLRFGVVAFVYVVLVNTVDVTVMRVVGVVAMCEPNVAAAFAVSVGVIGVRGVLNGAGH